MLATPWLGEPETKPEDAFNREHVIPEAFGLFENNLVLDCVCSECNHYFSVSFERKFARDAAEGLSRFTSGLKSTADFKPYGRARPLTIADLPPDLARFAAAQVAAGRHASVEDVLRAGKEALEHEQRRRERHEAKLAALASALEEGERSGVFEGDPFASVRAELGLSPRR